MFKQSLHPLMLVFCLSLAGSVSAAEAPQKAAVPPPPEIPEEAPPGGFTDDESSIEADVTIRKTKDKVVEEYRVNGELYMIKVRPRVGKPYILRYPEGSQGRVIRNELQNIDTPFWKLFEW